jgi:hypothetical protein
MSGAISVAWVAALTLSVVFDTGATAYLKLAGERLEGSGFLVATLGGVLVFAPSIILFGYALRVGPSYLASIGIWFVGAYATNALVGVLAFGDPFSARTVAGLVAAFTAVLLLSS